MIFIHSKGNPAREAVRRGFEIVATRIFCPIPPRLSPPPPEIRRHFTAPVNLPKLSVK